MPEAGDVQPAVARRRGVGGDVVLVAGRHAVLLHAVGPVVDVSVAKELPTTELNKNWVLGCVNNLHRPQSWS